MKFRKSTEPDLRTRILNFGGARLEPNLDFKGWSSRVQREFPGSFESTDLSREVGRASGKNGEGRYAVRIGFLAASREGEVKWVPCGKRSGDPWNHTCMLHAYRTVCCIHVLMHTLSTCVAFYVQRSSRAIAIVIAIAITITITITTTITIAITITIRSVFKL